MEDRVTGTAEEVDVRDMACTGRSLMMVPNTEYGIEAGNSLYVVVGEVVVHAAERIGHLEVDVALDNHSRGVLFVETF